MLNCTVKEREGKKTVYVGGSMTIRYIEKLLKVLRTACNERKDVVITLQNVTEIDLPALQLLCSAHKSLEAKGVNLVLAREYPDAVMKAIEEAGYIYNPIFNLQDKGGESNVQEDNDR